MPACGHGMLWGTGTAAAPLQEMPGGYTSSFLRWIPLAAGGPPALAEPAPLVYLAAALRAGREPDTHLCSLGAGEWS